MTTKTAAQPQPSAALSVEELNDIRKEGEHYGLTSDDVKLVFAQIDRLRDLHLQRTKDTDKIIHELREAQGKLKLAEAVCEAAGVFAKFAAETRGAYFADFLVLGEEMVKRLASWRNSQGTKP